MRTILRRLLIDRRGATAVEYGLIVSLIVIVMVASLQAVASQTIGMWNSVSSRVTQASNH
jgi:pilus assembly protein Flp/PilA